jgi:hypothetical protein
MILRGKVTCSRSKTRDLGFLAILFTLIQLVPGWTTKAQGNLKEYSIVVTKPEAEYTIDVQGAIDPENVEIDVENLSDQPVVNPRMTVNGLYDWHDVKSLVNEITRDCPSDEEKALAIWSWVHWKRFQREPHDDSSLNPVRGLNGYGYGICGHTSAWLKGLLTAAGLKARVWEITGHTISEAFYNGAWHMLDGNVKVFYLDRDNRTIASLATLEHNQWLIERTIHVTDPWFRGPDAPGRNREFVHYIITDRDNWESDGYDYEIVKPYTMAIALKPGEKLIRWWKPVLEKFEGRDKDPLVPERYANGRLVWEPDLKRIDMKDYIQVGPIGNISTSLQNGRDPAIHIAELQDGNLYDRASRFTIPIQSPYPIVGGRLFCALVKQGNSNLDQAEIFFGEPQWNNGDLYSYLWGKGTKNLEIDLDPSFLKHGVLYNYSIGFTLRGNAKSNPPTQAGVDHFRVITDLQVSPHSLPALSLGKNVIRYWDSFPGPRRVRITHRWREVNDRRPPEKVPNALNPSDGGVVATLTPTLRWADTTYPDTSDKVTDYQVMVSLRPDCRWPLSPTLHQNVGSAKPEWQVPATFLNPGTVYYWKVRARDGRGDIGEWSRVFQFKTESNSK